MGTNSHIEMVEMGTLKILGRLTWNDPIASWHCKSFQTWLFTKCKIESPSENKFNSLENTNCSSS